MNANDFLIWVRSTGMDIAIFVFIFGLLVRFLEVFMLGRKDLAEKRSSGIKQGFKTIATRNLPFNKKTFMKTALSTISGYVFHIGLFVIIFLFIPHIELFKSVFGFGWPGIPSPIVDFITVVTMMALLVKLWHRMTHPVVKYISGFSDYLAWAFTFIPLLTGYMCYHHLFIPYTWMLAWHILSVEILLILFPFTSLIHVFMLFPSRFYNGMMAGQKGVQQ
jgi:nitrate reductase gamma subunit